MRMITISEIAASGAAEVVGEYNKMRIARLAAHCLLRNYRKDGATWRTLERGHKWQNNHGEAIELKEREA